MSTQEEQIAALQAAARKQASELLAFNPIRFYSKEDHDRCIELLAIAIEAAAPLTIEVQLYRKDLQAIANWNTLQDTADTNLIKSFARASLIAIPQEALAPEEPQP